MSNPNMNQKQEDFSNEENIIPSELIKKEMDTMENVECMEIDEITPKVEKVEDNIPDPIFDNLRNLKRCDECGIHADCIVENKENGTVTYFCTKNCMDLNSSKTTPRLIYLQQIVQPSTSTSSSSSSSSALSALSTLSTLSSSSSSSSSSSLMKIYDGSSLYLRVCSTCSAIIQINDYSNISWQAHDFCNEKCLTKHQVRFNSYCVECKSSIVDANNFGKFSMKFGNNIRTFCSKICLDKYKITLNMCQFCNNDNSKDSHHKYLAPVTENSSTFKQFCSINCVKNYCHYKLKLPYQNEAENYATCAICNVLKFVQIKFQHKNIKTYMFCSENCYIKFQSYNRTKAVQCFICKILYEKIYFQKYCLYDNDVKNFCSQNCQTTYYIIARHIVECYNCKVKKYNFDMIQKTFPNNQTIYACSFECLKNSYKNMSRPIISSCSPNEINRLYGNLKNLMTLSIARNGALASKKNASTMCYPIKIDASTSTHNNTADKYTQTTAINENALIPTPVPIYVPAPVPFGQIPVPVCIPIPIPIPVPIFIPTGCKTQEEINTKLNKIWNEMPQDPLQTDLIMLVKTENTSNSNSNTEIEPPPPLPVPVPQPTRKQNKKKTTLKRKLVKKDYNFGLFTLKRWINATNAQTKHDAFNPRLTPKSNLYKTSILYMTRDELQNCLITFLENIKQIHSSETIYTIFLDIQNYLLYKNKKEYIFFDVPFKKFIEHLNTVIIGSHNIRKINPKLTEDYLWKTNQLGTHTPYTLLNSLIYFNFKLFEIKTVQEHLALLSMQISFSKKPLLNRPDSKLKYVYRLKYFPKNDYGKNGSEIDKQFQNQKRCPGFLYEFYAKKCPTAHNVGKSFYLKPELDCETDSPIWFSTQTLDEWTIEMMLNRIKMVKEINEA